MDPFSLLPPELRLIILTSMHTYEEAVSATRASPALLHVFRATEGAVIKGYVKYNLPASLLQDALAIIHFPRSQASPEERVALVDAHLQNWGAKKLPDPCAHHTLDISTMLELNGLCRKLWLYIKDYLSKATSPYLFQAYRFLPNWSHDRLLGNPVQQQLGATKDLHAFDMESLSSTQRRQILQAFLRYEVICKIYGPVASEPGLADSAPNPANPAEQFFRSWNWRILAHYEKAESDETGLVCSIVFVSTFSYYTKLWSRICSMKVYHITQTAKIQHVNCS